MPSSWPSPWQRCRQGLVLHIRLQARASRNRIVGLHGQALKISLTAPPVDGAANAGLIHFVAQLLQVPRATVSLQTGAKSRTKQLVVRTNTPDSLIRTLEEAVARLDKKKSDD